MPLLYGEGRKAFERLQQEIIRFSWDDSLLAWGSYCSGFWEKVTDKSEDYLDSRRSLGAKRPLLASGPGDFTYCANLAHVDLVDALVYPTVNNLTLSVQLPVLVTQMGASVVVLSSFDTKKDGFVGIVLSEVLLPSDASFECTAILITRVERPGNLVFVPRHYIAYAASRKLDLTMRAPSSHSFLPRTKMFRRLAPFVMVDWEALDSEHYTLTAATWLVEDALVAAEHDSDNPFQPRHSYFNFGRQSGYQVSGEGGNYLIVRASDGAPVCRSVPLPDALILRFSLDGTEDLPFYKYITVVVWRPAQYYKVNPVDAARGNISITPSSTQDWDSPEFAWDFTQVELRSNARLTSDQEVGKGITEIRIRRAWKRVSNHEGEDVQISLRRLPAIEQSTRGNV